MRSKLGSPSPLYLRMVTHSYACLCAHTMKHLRDFRSLSDSALAAKRAYHA